MPLLLSVRSEYFEPGIDSSVFSALQQGVEVTAASAPPSPPPSQFDAAELEAIVRPTVLMWAWVDMLHNILAPPRKFKGAYCKLLGSAGAGSSSSGSSSSSSGSGSGGVNSGSSSSSSGSSGSGGPVASIKSDSITSALLAMETRSMTARRFEGQCLYCALCESICVVVCRRPSGSNLRSQSQEVSSTYARVLEQRWFVLQTHQTDILREIERSLSRFTDKLLPCQNLPQLFEATGKALTCVVLYRR